MSCVFTKRCALFGIMGAGLVGAIAPKTPLRYVAMAIWLYSAIRGLQLAWEHTMIQLHLHRSRPAISPPASQPGCRWINGCRRFSLRPETVQYVSGSSCRWRCRKWLVGIFAAYLLVAILVIVAQPFKAKKRDLFGSLSRGEYSPQ
ncbi:disulfide bond formation protein B [Klebsiella pneumoniae subsp. pneumoniae]|nr:disulfide bond formation protein B [Klebsiella pneumoniae subsp. pneumoniae]